MAVRWSRDGASAARTVRTDSGVAAGARAPARGGQGGSPVAALRGIVLREERDSLVVQATPDEVAQFAVASPVAVAMLRQRDPEHEQYPCAAPGEILYTADGRPAGMVRDVMMSADRFDVTSFGDNSSRYVDGPRHIDIRLSGFAL